jgi:hypothetical protein
MKARVLAQTDVLAIVDLLRQQGYEVLAPFCGRGRDTYFDTVSDANRDCIQLHLPNPYYPPKRFVFPHIERLMKAERSNGDLRIEPTYEAPKRAIFGIRSCDGATCCSSIWSAPTRSATSARSASACAPIPARQRATILTCS